MFVIVGENRNFKSLIRSIISCPKIPCWGVLQAPPPGAWSRGQAIIFTLYGVYFLKIGSNHELEKSLDHNSIGPTLQLIKSNRMIS